LTLIIESTIFDFDRFYGIKSIQYIGENIT